MNMDTLGNAILISTCLIRRRLLEANEVDSVKRLASEVDIRDLKYFSQQFKLHFGKGLSEYLG